jgi:thiol:disulfide interchange protein DsbD
VWTISAIFFALAASMFGAFEFVLPSSLTNRLAQVGGIGYGGAFLLGLVSGVIAAPCTGPVLTGILLWIGKAKSAGLGAAVLFAFSIGLGIPFWLVGSFAVHLPKSGRWMVGVKSFFGIVLATAALYFLKNAVRPLGHPIRQPFALVCGTSSRRRRRSGAIHLSFGEGADLAALRRCRDHTTVAGLFLLIAGSTTRVISNGGDRARARARCRRSAPVLPFTEWCGACRVARDVFRRDVARPRRRVSRSVKVCDDPNVDR